jgi:membrane associated rhomboid family serine protease
MLIPISVDAVFERRPVVNWVVLGVLVVVFALQLVTAEKQVKKAPQLGEDLDKLELDKKKLVQERFAKAPAVTGPMSRFVLKKWGFVGLVAHTWLHPNIVRFLGNLLFLWVFGNAVCSKMGGKIYLPVYLGLGLLTGVIHLLFSSAESIGACGVLNGIVGMYIVFFPENAMNCYALLPRPMPVSLSGMWMVLIWFIFDVVETAMGRQSGAYWSHIGGLGLGAGLAVLMLEKKWVSMEKGERSLLQMFEKKQEFIETGKSAEGRHAPQDALRQAEEKKEVRKELIEDKQAAIEEQKKQKEKKDLEAMERLLGKRLQKSGAPADRRPAEVAKAEAKQEKPQVQIPAAEVKTATAEAKSVQNDFIHFQCTCGHKVKIPRKFAGLTGKCRKCGKSMQIPRT